MVRPLNKHATKAVLFSLLALLSTTSLVAAPIVLSDRGGIAMSEILNPPGESVESIEEIAAHDPAEMNNGLLSEGLYPIYTDAMQVGPIGRNEGQDIPSYLLTVPFFIVGYDRVSVNWMVKNLDHLVEKKAIGLVVNVETPDQMRELVERTGGRLPLTPMRGNELAKTLNLYHYPAYIDNAGLMR